MKHQRPEYGYIATSKKCGCIVGLIGDAPEQEKETAREVAEFIRDGCAIERAKIDSEQFKMALENFGHVCRPEQTNFF